MPSDINTKISNIFLQIANKETGEIEDYEFESIDENNKAVFKSKSGKEFKISKDDLFKSQGTSSAEQKPEDATSSAAQSELLQQGDVSATSDVANSMNLPKNEPNSSTQPSESDMTSVQETKKPNNQGGGFRYDLTSSMNSNIFKRTNLSETSVTETANLADLFSESVMDSTLDLSEFKHKSSKKNIFTPAGKMKGGAYNENKTLNMIRQKLQELQSSTIGMSIQNELGFGLSEQHFGQKGGKQMMPKSRLNEMGINSSSTSELCE